MKLTMVSITFRGVRYTLFVNLEGKKFDYDSFALKIGVQRGQTYTLS